VTEVIKNGPGDVCVERGARVGWAGLLVADLDVADESPCSDLELGAFARFHADALIPEECAAARDRSGPRRDTQPDVPDQVEDAKDGSFTGRSVAQVHPHIADEDHDLLIGPSGRKGVLRHVTQEREHRWSGRRPPGSPRTPHPEPASRRPQNKDREDHPERRAGQEIDVRLHARSVAR
jgi:hypothetical protein